MSFKETRRRLVKNTGRWLTRRMTGFLGSQSLIPDTPFVSPEPFPFLKEFEANWQAIRAEAEGILKHREEIPGFQEVSRDQHKLATQKNWRTFVLYGFGEPLKRNCAQVPRTAELLSRVPGLELAMFSILAPGYHIPAHRGVSKGILRAHLGLIIPRQAEACRIRVDNQIRPWKEGQLFVIDDTFEHEVWNDTDEERVILLFDFDRPMKPLGRLVSKAFIALVKKSAYWQEPKQKLQDFEARFEVAARRAEATVEALSEPAPR